MIMYAFYSLQMLYLSRQKQTQIIIKLYYKGFIIDTTFLEHQRNQRATVFRILRKGKIFKKSSSFIQYIY